MTFGYSITIIFRNYIILLEGVLCPIALCSILNYVNEYITTQFEPKVPNTLKQSKNYESIQI